MVGARAGGVEGVEPRVIDVIKHRLTTAGLDETVATVIELTLFLSSSFGKSVSSRASTQTKPCCRSSRLRSARRS